MKRERRETEEREKIGRDRRERERETDRKKIARPHCGVIKSAYVLDLE